MEINLKKNIYDYQVNKNKKSLNILLIHFDEIIYNISKKIKYEEAHTDLIIAFIELLDKVNLVKYNTNEKITKLIIHSLKNKRIDLFRKYILNYQSDISLNIDILNNNNIYKLDDSKIILEDLFKILSFNQKNVMILYFVYQYTDTEISQILKISRQAVWQIRKKSIMLLRDFLVA